MLQGEHAVGGGDVVACRIIYVVVDLEVVVDVVLGGPVLGDDAVELAGSGILQGQGLIQVLHDGLAVGEIGKGRDVLGRHHVANGQLAALSQGSAAGQQHDQSEYDGQDLLHGSQLLFVFGACRAVDDKVAWMRHLFNTHIFLICVTSSKFFGFVSFI